MVIKNNGNEEDARDIFQETLIILYRKIRENNLKLVCSLGTFIYSISRLLWLKELETRKKRKEDFIELDTYSTLDGNIIELAQKNERLRLYREHFEKLSEDCKKILSMFLNKVPIPEITGIMGFSSDQHTKNRRYRCKKFLITRIRNSIQYQELKNEKSTNDREIPRW